MALPKKDGADLGSQYPLYTEIGLVLSLAILIVAFRVDMSAQSDFEVPMDEQETVDVKQIQPTEHQTEPPPPPKPPVPQEVPDDQVIEREYDFGASIDPGESLDPNQGPPDTGEEKKNEDKVFIAVEEEPDCGGIRQLQKKVEYPDFAREAGIEGRVTVRFVVDEQGNVVNPRILRGVHELLDEEALRVVKDLQCTPGKQRGKSVKVQMSLPVTFRLQ